MVCSSALATGCNGPEAEPTAPDGKHPGGKADAFGRFLIGLASEYEVADPPLDEMALHLDMKQRRDAAWRTIAKVVEPVELFGLADPQKCSRVDPFEGVREDCEPIDTEFCTKTRVAEGASPDGEGDNKCTPIPTLPRWQTWYGEEDIKQMLRFLLEDLGKEGRKESPAVLGGEDRARLPSYRHADRPAAHVAGRAPRPGAQQARRLRRRRQRRGLRAAAAGPARRTRRLRPGPDLLQPRSGCGTSCANYKPISECDEILRELPIDAEERSPTNFSACFNAEFPENAAIVKAQWIRSLIGEGGQPSRDAGLGHDGGGDGQAALRRRRTGSPRR